MHDVPNKINPFEETAGEVWAGLSTLKNHIALHVRLCETLHVVYQDLALPPEAKQNNK
jgi:hypothetical protein